MTSTINKLDITALPNSEVDGKVNSEIDSEVDEVYSDVDVGNKVDVGSAVDNEVDMTAKLMLTML